MKKFFTKLFGRDEPAKKRASARSIAAALGGVATSDMLEMNAPIDHLCRAHLSSLRRKSRALAINSDYMRSFLRMLEQHVVGPDGIRMQLKARDANGALDTFANTRIEEEFALWSQRKNCDTRARLTFRAMQKMVVRSLARDGEVFIRKVRKFRPSRHKFSLQLLPPEFIDETLFDDFRNIRCGIEYDANDRPAAYYAKQSKWSDGSIVLGNGRNYIRIPADEIVHVFMSEYAGQSRGLPWCISSMIRLHHIGSYEEAEVVAARLAAAKMGFFKRPEGTGALADSEDAPELNIDVSPGSMFELPPGYEFEKFDAQHPSGNYAAFVKAALKGIAAGLGVDYPTIASDLEGVNYSSIRAGLLETRELWKSLQREFKEQFLDEIFPDWLDSALAFDLLNPLPMAKFDKFNKATWQFRGWAWVDPDKDASATLKLIAANMKSRTQALAEQGIDFEELCEQIAEEKKILKSYGLSDAIELKPTGKSEDQAANDDSNSNQQEEELAA